jgi:hypothetical protein
MSSNQNKASAILVVAHPVEEAPEIEILYINQMQMSIEKGLIDKLIF